MILRLYKPSTPTFKFSSSDTTTRLTTILCLPLPTLLCSLSLNKASATMPTTAPLTCPSPPSHPSLRRVPRRPLFPTPKPTSFHPPQPAPSSSAPQSVSSPSSSALSSWKMMRFRLKISLSFQLQLSLPNALRKSRSRSSSLKPSTTTEKPTPKKNLKRPPPTRPLTPPPLYLPMKRRNPRTHGQI